MGFRGQTWGKTEGVCRQEARCATEAPLLTRVLEGRGGAATAAPLSGSSQQAWLRSAGSGSADAQAGCPHVEAEYKPIPRGCMTVEVELKSACPRGSVICRLVCCWRICKLSACGTSEWITGVSVAEAGEGQAVRVHVRRGTAGAAADPTAPMAGASARPRQC